MRECSAGLLAGGRQRNRQWTQALVMAVGLAARCSRAPYRPGPADTGPLGVRRKRRGDDRRGFQPSRRKFFQLRGVVCAKQPNFPAMGAFQLAQAGLVDQPGLVVSRHQPLVSARHRGAGISVDSHFTAEEIRVAGVEEPTFRTAHRHTAMTECARRAAPSEFPAASRPARARKKSRTSVLPRAYSAAN
jgi:hypothetical protein